MYNQATSAQKAEAQKAERQQAEAQKGESAPTNAKETYYIPTMAVHKKYRALSYSIHDNTYANNLANIYYISHSQETKEKFNSFSEFLMDEPAINRDKLLDAIDDYNKTADRLKFPLSVYFTDAAWIFRSYQSW